VNQSINQSINICLCSLAVELCMLPGALSCHARNRRKVRSCISAKKVIMFLPSCVCLWTG